MVGRSAGAALVTRRLAVVGDRDERYETHRGIDRVLASLPESLAGAWHATDELEFDDIAAAAGVWIAPGHAVSQPERRARHDPSCPRARPAATRLVRRLPARRARIRTQRGRHRAR